MQMLLEEQRLSEQEENKNPSMSITYPGWVTKLMQQKALLCFYCVNTTVAVICRAGACKYD